MQCVQKVGAEYGLELNLGKLEALTVKCDERILDSKGNCIKNKESVVYLGGLLSADRRTEHELNRRIGLAIGRPSIDSRN